MKRNNEMEHRCCFRRIEQRASDLKRTPCILMPQRMHSSRLVYVMNKVSEQNGTALFLAAFILSLATSF